MFMFKNFDKLATFSNHNYSTRGKFSLSPKFQPTNITQQSIAYHGPKTWNSLPDYMKNIQTLPAFKFKLRKLLLSQYR